ncbi:MAG: YlxR family protein [Thermoleophilaceae bacterium]|nr:YlxR family protein [Thermoleophilaceae bacterium]
MACGESLPRDRLSRFVRDAEGRLRPDPDGRAEGRGAYVCESAECRSRAADGHVFARSFRAPVTVDSDDL